MRKTLATPCIAIAFLGLGCSDGSSAPGDESGETTQKALTEIRIFYGLCDASASFFSGERFYVLNDEDNALHEYGLEAGSPTGKHELHRLFPDCLDAGTDEMDLEGATTVGDKVYLITSHGRNKNGKFREARHFMFGVETQDGGGFGGAFCFGDLIPAVRQLEGELGQVLWESIRYDQLDDGEPRDIERLAPKDEGFNIEGFTIKRGGGSLLIGLRNPLFDGKAVVLETNALEEVETGSVSIAGTHTLDLGGLGIRSMEYSDAHGGYLIAAGSTGSEDIYRLYHWSGEKGEAPREILKGVLPGHFSPEGLVVEEATGRVFLLSDQGGRSMTTAADGTPITEVDCKDLEDPSDRRFEMLIIKNIPELQ